MSGAHCHLANRMPHNAMWGAYASVPTSRSQASIDKQLHHISAKFERLVYEFAASFEQQRDSTRSRINRRTGQRKLRASELTSPALITASDDPILKAVYETHPGAADRVRVPALYDNLTQEEDFAFLRGWVTEAIDGYKGTPHESLQVLLAHGRRAELEFLIDRGVDLNSHANGGYSNLFNGGLGHILSDNVMYYIALNQMLLHGWAPAECQRWEELLEEEVLADNLSLKDHRHFMASTDMSHLPEMRMRRLIAAILRDLCDVHDFRKNKEETRFAAFRGMLDDGSATLDDVRAFCKDVLFPQMVLGAHLYRYNDQKHGSRPSARAVATGGPEAWQQYKTSGWDVAEWVEACMRDVFGVHPKNW